jgi:pimeloyl-ACP methyl ester carboxylesterase
MASSADPSSGPTGPGSVAGTSGLPAGFADTFASRWVDVGSLRLHAVVGGDGAPLLLIAGWPQTWYAWRLVMPALARGHTVVAVDTRGVGLSGKPTDGYDVGTLAADLVELMQALGHDRFAVFGHDVGMWIGYALAADFPHRVDRLALAEALIPGLSPSPPVLDTQDVVDRLWHFMFNRIDGLPEQLVRGREDVFLRWQFEHKAVHALDEAAIAHYVDSVRRDPGALRASFAFYRAITEDIAQNVVRAATPLPMPVLTVAGDGATGRLVEQSIVPVASEVRSVVVPDCGHYPAEEAPEATLAAATEFFAPWRGTRGR